jgi:predicted SAM-dependent methyltransferase
MTITIKSEPNQRIIELGGGDNPNPACEVNVDVRPGPKTNFVADFNEPLPINSDEWDGVFSQFVIEHLSWRKVRQFISEVFRILKPGGKAVIVTANTEAQMEWIKNHPEGWDGKSFFDSASCILFGDQDYPENSHKNYMSFGVAKYLFSSAGFENIKVLGYGNAMTDLVIEATKPGAVRTKAPEETKKSPHEVHTNVFGTNVSPMAHHPVLPAEPVKQEEYKPDSLFDKAYFNGGGRVGGYAREGYWDYPVHHVTAQHILSRDPKSVLEIGAARGYILKRVQDAGVMGVGLEVSKHCYMTRVADRIINHNICKTPWPVNNGGYDLCYSVATLEHIPESYLPAVVKEMQRTCRRGLHGIDFGDKDDGFDKTHCSLKPKSFWEDIFRAHAPDWPVEIVDKEELERGTIPTEILHGDGKIKLNIGSFTTMFHHGWENIDVHDLYGFAQQHGYKYRRHDIRQGIPYGTGVVDLIFCCHMLEHLTYQEGIAFLRECRRVIRPGGAMRFIVPDAKLLMRSYGHGYFWDVCSSKHDSPPTPLDDFDEINDGCAASPTDAGKLWALLHEGHNSCYDGHTLVKAMESAMFDARVVPFRSNSKEPGIECLHDGLNQILCETLDMLPCLSLYVDAIPLLGDSGKTHG